VRYNQKMSTKDSRTYADRREYLIKAVAKRRKDLRLRAVTLLGGKCQICGYDKHASVLDFHHIDPTTKLFGISSGGFSRSWLSIEAEVKKCILVCANCHREIELGLVKPGVKDLQSVDKPLE
jgi:predicted HNH restriction endonuclease